MTPIYVRIRGFLSFAKDQTLTFPDQPGLYMMGGRNLVYPEKGPNAVGKTAAWQAISWALTGETSRGLKAGNVENWSGSQRTMVEYGFSIGGVEYFVTRTRKPNKLTLAEGAHEARDVTQDELDRITKQSRTVLSSTMMMSQFADFFFDLKPAARLKLFSDVFDLDYWIARSDVAKKKLKDAREAVLDLRNQHGRETARREEREVQLSKARELADAWSDLAEERHAKLADRLIAAEEDLVERFDAKDAARREHRKALGRKEEAQERLVAADDARNAAKLKRVKTAAAVDAAKKDRAKVRTTIRRLEALEGDCPTCLQPVEPDLSHACVLALKANDGAKAVRALKRTTRAHTTSCDAYEQANAERHDAEAAFIDAERAEKRASTVATDAARAALGAEGTVDRLRKETQDVATQAADNPHAGTVVSLEKAMKRGRTTARRLKKKLEDALKTEDRLSYWVTTFRDIRLWLVEQWLTELTITTNNALPELGLNGWSVSFDIERPTKAGGVSKGFSVFIESPDSGAPVVWEAFSGGETQRLRIAGAIALSDLICSHHGIMLGAEVWDEPTQYLSEEGIDDLVRYLKGRARTTGRQVWLIDHRALSGGDFDARVDVELTEAGSRIVV